MDQEDYLAGLRNELENAKRAQRGANMREIQREIDRVTGKPHVERAVVASPKTETR